MNPHPRVARVAFLAPGSLDLTFADGAAFLVPVAALDGMPPVAWETATLAGAWWRDGGCC